MKFKFLPALLPALLLTTGCSSFFGSEPPARSATKAQPIKAVVKKNQPAAQKPAPGTGTATYPLDSGQGNFKDESTVPAFHAEPLTAPALQAPGAALIPETQTPVAATAGPAATPAPAPAPAAETDGVMPVNILLEDASIPSGTSPAVVALVSEADNSRKRGDLETAVLVMERALRIDPRNPVITYKLAQIRFKQNKFKQAEELAGKASLLAGGNLELKRKSLMLIAEARKIQRNFPNLSEPKPKPKPNGYFGR
ncbi:MAG: tetratricopeptide repeat protein [Methylococcales bacterium]|nr:tetratricopeptide repeat protein [Methylococcales bacterium]